MDDTNIGDYMKNNSIWLSDLQYDVSNSLDQSKECDILIIGGGMTGMATAYHLRNSGLQVCLVEKNKIGHGVTARSTAKLTYLQELMYSNLAKIHSKEQAKLYYQSQKDAIQIVSDIVSKYHIDCDFKKVSSYVYTDKDSDVSKIKNEYEILSSFGVDVKSTTTLPNGVACKYGIYVEDTAVFHPLKYLYGLKKVLEDTISFYENTTVTSIKKVDGGYVCIAGNYEIKCKKIVLALHYPYFVFPYLFPLKVHLEKSYICAFPVTHGLDYSAITSSSPVTSIRYHSDKKHDYQIYLNGSHNLCMKNNEKEMFRNLIDEVNQEPSYLWSNIDVMTDDFLPYIGRLQGDIFIGTGYQTWGMTNGNIAGKVLSDLVMEKNNRYSVLFSPHRGLHLTRFLNSFVSIGSNVKSFVGSKVIKNKRWYSDRVQFFTLNGKPVASYTDDDGKKYLVYNRCPHLKCSLIFNEVEKTWDCPCHGSRFDLDGKCIEGPSNYDISISVE